MAKTRSYISDDTDGYSVDWVPKSDGAGGVVWGPPPAAQPPPGPPPTSEILWAETATLDGSTANKYNFTKLFKKGSNNLVVYADGLKLKLSIDYTEAANISAGDGANNITLIGTMAGFTGVVEGINLGNGPSGGKKTALEVLHYGAVPKSAIDSLEAYDGYWFNTIRTAWDYSWWGQVGINDGLGKDPSPIQTYTSGETGINTSSSAGTTDSGSDWGVARIYNSVIKWDKGKNKTINNVIYTNGTSNQLTIQYSSGDSAIVVDFGGKIWNRATDLEPKVSAFVAANSAISDGAFTEVTNTGLGRFAFYYDQDWMHPSCQFVSWDPEWGWHEGYHYDRNGAACAIYVRNSGILYFWGNWGGSSVHKNMSRTGVAISCVAASTSIGRLWNGSLQYAHMRPFRQHVI